MNVTVAEQDGLKRKLQVEVPLSDVQSAYDEVFGRLRGNLRVNGFRPGKYPRHLAERRFQSVMTGEALQTLVPKYFQRAIEELSLKPATEPRFDNLEIDKQKPLRFDVAFEVVPQFELVKPGDYTLTEQKTKVGPKEIAARIEEQRTARAALVAKGESPAAAGDVVTFDFHGTLDGEDFEGGSAENQRIEVGAGQYLPDFDAQFPGIRAGEQKAFDLTFPDDYGQASLRGKTVHFEVTARSVEEKQPPQLDAEFFKQFGSFETLEEFQGHIKAQLETEQARETLQGYQHALADQMREVYDFAVPEALVSQGLHEFEHQLEHNDPELLKDEAKLEARKAEERGKIEGNLRVAYVVDAMATDYDIKVDAEEVRQRFMMQAYMMRQNPQELMNTEFGNRMLVQIEQTLMTAACLERLANDVLSGGKGGGKAAPKESAAKDAAAAESDAPAGKAPKRGKAAGKAGGKAGAKAKGGDQGDD